MHAIREPARRGRLILLMLAVVAALAGSAAVAQDSPDQEFLAGLRARRLYELAATFCRDQLTRSEIGEERRAELYAELVRIYGEQALQLPADQRGPWWQRAQQAADEYARTASGSSYGVWVRVQEALVALARGEVTRQEAEVARGDRDAQFAAALEALRDALLRMQTLDKDLEKLLPAAPGSSNEAGLGRDELFALRNQVRLYHARTLRNRGLCYPEGDDRIAALSLALMPLRDALTQLPADDPLAWQVRLEQLICQRLLGNLPEARRVQASLAGAEVPANLRTAVRAEEVRLALAEGDPQRAMSLATSNLPAGPAAELDFARLEVFVNLWQANAARPMEAESFRTKALALVQYIEQQHGAYWGRRADQLLLRSAEGGQAPADVEILRRKADDLFLQDKWKEALETYDLAAAAAAKANAVDEEFLCRGRSARVAEKLQDFAAAQQRWHDLALALRAHPQAPAAHFESIQMTIRLARGDAGRLEDYRRQLAEHLATWPQSEHAHLVRVWLGNLHRHDRQWDAALDAYGAVAADSSSIGEAVEGALEAWRGKWKDAGQPPTSAQVDAMLNYFAGLPSGSPSATAGELAAARLILEHAPQRAADAERLLQQTLGAGQLDAERHSQVESLLAVALALQPTRQAAALEQLRKMAGATPDQLLDTVRQLGQQMVRLPPTLQAQLAASQLDLLDRLATATLPAEQQLEAARLRAQALGRAGRSAEAAAAYATLVKAHPRDGGLQLEYARALESAAGAQGWQPALDQWRTLARFTRPRSDEWYESKCGVARAMAALGQRDEAAKVLRYVLLTTAPESGSPWDRALRELLSELEKNK